MVPRLVFIQCKDRNIVWDTCKEYNGAVILNEPRTQEQ